MDIRDDFKELNEFIEFLKLHRYVGEKIANEKIVSEYFSFCVFKNTSQINSVIPPTSEVPDLISVQEAIRLIPGLGGAGLRKLVEENKIKSFTTTRGSRERLLISKPSLLKYFSN